MARSRNQQTHHGGEIDSWSHAEIRERVLTRGASGLSRTRRTLWYLETLVLSSRYQQWLRSSEWSKGALKCRSRTELWTRTLLPRIPGANACVLEFGVANGHATRWWATNVGSIAEWHGFDTFAGLPADWSRGGVSVMAAGVFAPEAGAGHFPSVPPGFPVTWHVGMIEETLGQVRQRPAELPLLILIDVDLKQPTDTVLRWLESHGKPGDLIYFDEAFDPWNEGASIRESIDRGLRLRALGYTGSALSVEILATPEPRSTAGEPT